MMTITNPGTFDLLPNKRTREIKQILFGQMMEGLAWTSRKLLELTTKWCITTLKKVTKPPASSKWNLTAVYDIVDAGPRHSFLVKGEDNEWRKVHNCDYGSQEAFIAPILSGDAELLRAYTSGDPYLAFAKATGAAPEGATKDTHKDIRTLYKSTVLGLQYGMGAAKLAIKLSADTGRSVSTGEAKELIRQHRDVYPRYYEWKDELWARYRDEQRPLFLRDGWYLDIDQMSRLSALNFPVQGTGSSMMRVCIDMLYDEGIDLICPVHDSMIVECDEDKAEHVTKIVTNCMLEASKKILGAEGMRVGEPEIVKHGGYWETEKNIYDLPKFKKYFENKMNHDPNQEIFDFVTKSIDT